MSIVTIHGPYTFGSRAIVQNPAGTVSATVNPTNGMIWTFSAKDQSQVAANYDWTYTPAGGSPASPINDTKNPVITFTGVGAKTVTLTLNGVAQAPIIVNTVTGAGPPGSSLRSLPPDEEEELPDDGGYDPGDYTVTEVIGHVEDNPDELDAVIAAEEAGKARITLLTHLESMRPA